MRPHICHSMISLQTSIKFSAFSSLFPLSVDVLFHRLTWTVIFAGILKAEGGLYPHKTQQPVLRLRIVMKLKSIFHMKGDLRDILTRSQSRRWEYIVLCARDDRPTVSTHIIGSLFCCLFNRYNFAVLLPRHDNSNSNKLMIN